jgi:transglutaminase-like putative cysteine protease
MSETSATMGRLRPSRDELVDAAFLFALTIAALAGFHSAYGGWTFLVVGVVGAVSGVVVGHVTSRLQLPPLVSLVVGVSALLLLGSAVAMRDHVLLGFVPQPSAFTGFVDGLVSGWRRLLTTTAPSGSLGNLLAISFFLGFVTTWLTTLMSRRPSLLASLLVLPGFVLILSLLFGTRDPFSVVLQGAVAAVVSIGWLATRRARNRHNFIGSSGSRRLVGAVAMLAVIAVIGFAVGPNLPLAAANSRYVLRDKVDPPFDPREYGSPLNAFQRYLVGDWEDQVLFTAQGLPPVQDGEKYTYLRMAVMDDYDGVVWRVSPRSDTQGGRFLRVGEEIPTDAIGDTGQIEVTIDALRGVWMPDYGVVAGVEWLTDGERASDQRDLFRLSTVTNTGVLPIAGGWQARDRYRLDLVVPAPLSDSDVVGRGVNAQEVTDVSPAIPEEIRTVANLQTKGKASPLEQANALVSYLRDGYYQSGDLDLDESNAPGHSYARLIEFLENDQPVGNAEQYASAMALMARSLGIPARVVMGFRVPPGETEVRGSDVHAWVEIGFDNGWKQFDPTSERREKPQQTTKKPKPIFESQDVPPPPVVPPEPEVNARQGEQAKRTEARKPEQATAGAGGISPVLLATSIGVGLPAIALGIFALTVLALKRRRRRRRFNAAQPATRVAGGWDEYVDAARDIGLPVPLAATRREKALMIGAETSVALASDADRSVFGAAEPVPDEIDQYWSSVDRGRQELREPLSLWGRITSSLSTASLRKPQ